MSGSVHVFGALNLDRSMRVARIPVPGETVKAIEYKESAGGKGSNQAAAAALAGAMTTMTGAVGADPNGQAILQALHARAVDVTTVRAITGSPTGTACIVVQDDGENAITIVEGANAKLDRSSLLDSRVAQASPGDIVVLQNEINPELTFAAAELAHRRGARVLWNSAPAPMDGWPAEFVDVLVANQLELTAIAHGLNITAVDPGALVIDVEAAIGAAVVCTVGSRGAWASIGGRVLHVDSPRVHVVDTTAAGDTFVGYLAADLARGVSLADALNLAATAASLTVTKAGAIEAIPSRTEAEAFMTTLAARLDG